MVVFDATYLLPLLWPDIPPPREDSSQAPVDGFRERIDYLIERLEKDRTKIIVPTPALSEILVRAGSAGAEYLDRINRSAAFRIAPFDARAAVEVAAITREALDAGNKRDDLEGTWAKIKYDRQIVAIAKVEGASVLYTDDRNIRKLGSRLGLTTIPIRDLPLRPKEPIDPQRGFFEEAESDEPPEEPDAPEE